MMWVTYYLAMYPEMQEELRAEMESICGLDKKEITFEEMTAMKKTGYWKKNFWKLANLVKLFNCESSFSKILNKWES